MSGSGQPRSRSEGAEAGVARWMLWEPLNDLKGYRLGTLRRDAIAGLTVAVVAVPQSLAYAVIAGVPPEIGVYTLIVQSVIGAFVGSQPFLSSGPINTQSLLVAAIATRALGQQQVEASGDASLLYLELVVGLTLLKGLVQIGLAAGGLGNLVRYVSRAVILGFTAGAGVLIAAGQLGAFLGIDVPARPGRWPALAGLLQGLAEGAASVRPASIAVGLAGLAVVIGIRRLSPLAPGPLLAVVAGAGIVAGMGWTETDLPLVSALPGELPAARWPSLSLGQVEPLIGGAFALAVVGLLEAWSIGKTIALQSGQRISATQELLGQGITNLGSSFFGCMPGSGSFTRSALNVRSGAATRYAGLWNAAFAASMLLVFAPLAALIPRAALSAILFVIAYDLVDWRAISRIVATSRSDAAVCAATFAATLAIPLAYAVFVGVLLNLGLYLRRASRLHLAEMIPPASEFARTSFEERPLERSSQRPPGDPTRAVVFLQLQGDLFFGQADELEERLADLEHAGTRVVIIRLKRTLSIDSTVMGVLERFALSMRHHDGRLILCGVRPEVTTSLRAYGILRSIGEDCFFEATPGVFASAERALRRARELVGPEVDLAELEEQALTPDEES